MNFAVESDVHAASAAATHVQTHDTSMFASKQLSALPPRERQLPVPAFEHVHATTGANIADQCTCCIAVTGTSPKRIKVADKLLLHTLRP